MILKLVSDAVWMLTFLVLSHDKEAFKQNVNM